MKFKDFLVTFAFFLLLLPWPISAREVIPPPPQQYFNDTTAWIKPETAKSLEVKLKSLQQENGAQLVVAIYSKMQSDKDIADYCTRVGNAWGIGEKGKDNGLVLFVFKEDRKLWLAVGSGLEKIVTNKIAKDIIETEIVPSLKKGDPDEGLRRGVDAIILATKGKYKAPSTGP